MFSRENISS